MTPITLTNQHLTRQADLIPSAVYNTPIHIIGAGAIGSFTSLALAKSGFINQTVWDFDEVSIENMSTQFYRHRDIGKPKVAALFDLVHDFTNEPIGIRNLPFLSTIHAHYLSGIVIAAADCMKVREDILAACRVNMRVTHLIDARMGAEVIAMYAGNPKDSEFVGDYQRSLYSNEEAVQERCTAKATMYTVQLVTGLIVKTVKNILCGNPYPRNVQWSVDKSENNMNAMAMTMYSTKQ